MFLSLSLHNPDPHMTNMFNYDHSVFYISTLITLWQRDLIPDHLLAKNGCLRAPCDIYFKIDVTLCLRFQDVDTVDEFIVQELWLNHMIRHIIA